MYRSTLTTVDNGRLTKQVLHWEADSAKQRMERPRKNWIYTVNKI